MHGHSALTLRSLALKIERQKLFLPARRPLFDVYKHNPASEQPSSEGLTNPHKLSTLLTAPTATPPPYPHAGTLFLLVRVMAYWRYQSRAFIRHQLVSGYDYYFV